ncbi:MAG: hypothetical protein ACOCYB_00025 [Alkalispirochaeta sp.]
MVRPDNRLVGNGSVRLVVLFFLLAGTSSVALVGAQTSDGGAELQPAVDLVFVAEMESLSESEQRATALLFSAVEGTFRSQRRYRLSRTNAAELPEPGGRPTAFVSVAPRRDGRLGVETDVWDGSEFTSSEVFDLPLDRDRFSVVEDVAQTVAEEIAGLFPGFGRVRFSNDGYAASYYVYVDGALLGANIDEIELPRGAYEFEVRRRDDGFEQVVGRRDVRLDADDYLELRFSLARTPPPIPGFLRLTDPNERWSALFDIRGSYLIPLDGFDVLDTEFGAAVIASALFNDVLISGLVLGGSAGHVYTTGNDVDFEDVSYEFNVTPAMGVLGLSVGPVSGVDFIVRGAGGMALTRADTRVPTPDGSDEVLVSDGLSPAFEGVMEFGFGIWRNLRLSLHSSWFGIWEDEQLFSWIGVGLGIGGRY